MSTYIVAWKLSMCQDWMGSGGGSRQVDNSGDDVGGGSLAGWLTWVTI